MQTQLTFFFAFVVVLALIGLVAWLVRRFAGNRLGANANRGRMPRLAVIDAAAVDGRRRLVLVRRDNVEHLLMIGGPTDIVVESNIVRANPAREQVPQRPGADAQPRHAPVDAGNWDVERPADLHEPQLPEPPRPPRPPFADEVRRPAPPMAPERRSVESPSFVPEPVSRREPHPEPRPEPRLEPAPRMPRAEPAMPRVEAPMPRAEPQMPRPTRPAEPPKAPPMRAERPMPPPPPPAPSISAADQNLADMANRLEAALRRPAGADLGEPRVGAPPVAPEPPPGRPVPRASEPPRQEAPVAAPAKSGFENLEDEMASLLGRPKTPS